MTAMIEAHGLRHRFGRTTALDGLDLTAEAGQVVAVLGPNGAGKTTFVRAVATLLRPDAGTLLVAGHDVRRDPGAVRRMVGLAGQSAAVEPALTGRENVRLVARLRGMGRASARAHADELVTALGLDDAADRRARTYSGGMRRRLDLAASLVGQPRLLLLDEPTTGVDPRSRIELWDAIRRMVADGTDVLLTTQYLDEADALAAHVVIIDHGRVVASGSPADLKRRVGGNVLEARVRDHSDLPGAAGVLGTHLGGTAEIDVATRRVRIAAEDGLEQIAAAMVALDTARIAVDEVGVRSPSLDEVFLALTGHTAEAADTAA